MPESGQGALGPALVPVGQAYRITGTIRSSRTAWRSCSMPSSTTKFGSSFRGYGLPKGRRLAEYVNENRNAEWSKTRSCWQDNRHASVNGKRRQCGICAACMLRRLSVHRAGLTEERETYVWENLKARSFEEATAVGLKKIDGAQREYAIAGTLHLDHLAGLKGAAIHASTIRLNASQLAKALDLTERTARDNLDRLLDKHAIEWKTYMVSLGPQSFVNRWIGRAA